MNAHTRASVIAGMPARIPTTSGFKRQVVFRLGVEDWPLLEAAVAEHGSIQAALLAALRALGASPARPGSETTPPKERGRSEGAKRKPAAEPATSPAGEPKKTEEIPAREAAKMLGLKSGTVRGYIRSGRLAGRYDGGPSFGGWLTTQDAVEQYRRARS